MLEFFGGDAAYGLNHVGGYTHSQAATANHHHLRHSGGQRQHQFELCAFACNGGGFNPAADAVDFSTHHVHADTATGQFCDLCSRGETRHENQIGSLLVINRLVSLYQAGADGFFTNTGQVQTCAVVAELH